MNGEWKWLFRAVDKQGRTVDFLLTHRRNAKARIVGQSDVRPASSLPPATGSGMFAGSTLIDIAAIRLMLNRIAPV